MNRLTYVLVISSLLFISLSYLNPAGLWFYEYTSSYNALYILFFVLSIILFLKEVDSRKTKLSKPLSDSLLYSTYILIIPAAFSLLMFISYRRFVPPPSGLGDSLLLIEKMPLFTEIFGYLDSFDELVALFIYSKAYLILKQTLALDSIKSYAVVSSLMGAFYTVVVIHFLRKRSLDEKFWGVLFFLGTPAIQIYAGYPENYAPVAMLIAIITLSIVKRLESGQPVKNSFFMITGALSALAVTTHLIAAFLLPSLIYFVFVLSNRNLKLFIRRSLISVSGALPVLAIVWIYFFFITENPVAFQNSFSTAPPIYPVSRMISSRHILDMLNLSLFANPAIILFAIFFIMKRPSSNEKHPSSEQSSTRQNENTALAARFSGIAAGGILFATFIINPLLSYPADWDIHSIFQFPLNVFLFYKLKSVPSIPNKKFPESLLFSLSATLILGATISWISFNASSDAESEANIAFIQEAVVNQTETLKEDPIIKNNRIELSDKKRYVEIKMFEYRALRDLKKMDSEESENLRAKLVKIITELKRSIQNDNSGTDQHLEKAWNNLIIINTAISELKQARTN